MAAGADRPHRMTGSPGRTSRQLGGPVSWRTRRLRCPAAPSRSGRLDPGRRRGSGPCGGSADTRTETAGAPGCRIGTGRRAVRLVRVARCGLVGAGGEQLARRAGWGHGRGAGCNLRNGAPASLTCRPVVPFVTAGGGVPVALRPQAVAGAEQARRRATAQRRPSDSCPVSRHQRLLRVRDVDRAPGRGRGMGCNAPVCA